MTEYRTRTLARTLLLEELRFACSAMPRHEIATAAVSFGWDSNLSIEEMWKDQIMPTGEVLVFVNAAEEAGTIEVGKADVFIEGTNFIFQLCHESDAHVKGSSLLVSELVDRWKTAGYAPYEVELPVNPRQDQ